MSSFWFQQFSSSPFFIDKNGDLIGLFSSPYHKTHPSLADAFRATHCFVTISRTCLSVLWYVSQLGFSQYLPWHHQHKCLIVNFLPTWDMDDFFDSGDQFYIHNSVFGSSLLLLSIYVHRWTSFQYHYLLGPLVWIPYWNELWGMLFAVCLYIIHIAW